MSDLWAFFRRKKLKESYDDIVRLRRKVFEEVARIAYAEDGIDALRDAPFKILPGEVAHYRESIFHERAIIEERLRLAMGMDVRSIAESEHVTDGFEEINIDQNVYSSPLVNVIKFACEACPGKQHFVTDNCRKCLAKPCLGVCPKKAVHLGKDRAIIDPETCVNCGLCQKACPFQAIVLFDRPCASVCGVDAISSDAYGRAEIDQDKCVSCGRCVTQCPFGAVADKSQIFQLVKGLKDPKKRIYAMVAPSFVGQFGSDISPGQVFQGIKDLGFEEVYEVGLGADMTSLREAQEFLERVPEEIPFMGTSCCYSWSLLVDKNFPELNDSISDSASPMRYTASYIHEKDPTGIICFIGPCTSKKTEAIETKVKSYVEFVITFEELYGSFEARGIDLSSYRKIAAPVMASASARGYAVAGGVAKSVKDAAGSLQPEREIKIVGANSLQECVRILKDAKRGKYDGYLIEGMACPGGCIAGMGTLAHERQATRQLKDFMASSDIPSPFENPGLQEEIDFDVHRKRP